MSSLDRTPLLSIALALTLALSSLSTKAMGLAWIVIVFAGAWYSLTSRALPPNQRRTSLATTWLVTCLIALAVKSLPVFYWSDPWRERHGELRMLFIALAIYGLMAFKKMSLNTLHTIANAFALSAWAGLIWVVVHGRAELTTHPIPWAGAMAMVSAFLLSISLNLETDKTYKWFWFMGGLAAIGAVLSSESRGAYGIVFWWAGVGLHHIWSRRKKTALTSKKTPQHNAFVKFTLSATLAMGLVFISQSPIGQRPIQAIGTAIAELEVSMQSAEAGANSSVGARIYLWKKSWEAIQNSPLIGHGHDQRKAMISSWAEMAQSDVIKGLGHVHNEYLQQLLDHGLLGLFSQLCYLVGLFTLMRQLYKAKQILSATALSGLLFVHISASLSNVNFAHNYYTVTFSLLIAICLWAGSGMTGGSGQTLAKGQRHMN